MVVHFGYEDGSGRYYVSIDQEKCTACGACVSACPQKILATESVMIDLDFKDAAAVLDSERKKIKYQCGPCHEAGTIFCANSCEKGAIVATWETK
jgi:Fe-S-cluster-containing hydrogenase component 2